MRHAPAPTLTPNIFECSCGTVHNSGDGRLPVGWSTVGSTAWCLDCTRAGIPARELRGRKSGRRAA